MTKNEIIERLAREGHIERMARAIYKRDTPELHDLVQIVLLALLEKPEDTIVKADREGWLPFLCLNIVKKQATSTRSPFYAELRRFSARTGSITETILNIPDNDE